jgi:hypothetical protein
MFSLTLHRTAIRSACFGSFARTPAIAPVTRNARARRLAIYSRRDKAPGTIGRFSLESPSLRIIFCHLGITRRDSRNRHVGFVPAGRRRLHPASCRTSGPGDCVHYFAHNDYIQQAYHVRGDRCRSNCGRRGSDSRRTVCVARFRRASNHLERICARGPERDCWRDRRVASASVGSRRKISNRRYSLDNDSLRPR